MTTWPERLERQIIVETGDGERYEPQWMDAILVQEYNVSIFNFPNVPGTLVRRRQPRGRRFSLKIFFQGADHIETSERFRRSAEDSRHWHVLHPLWDEIRVQPIRITFDNRKYGLTQITADVVETVSGIFPREVPAFRDEIANRKSTLDTTTANMYGNQTSNIQAAEVTTVQDAVTSINDSTGQSLLNETDQISFRNVLLDAQSAVNNLVTGPIAALRSVEAAINFPIQVVDDVRRRVSTLINQFDRVVNKILNITGVSRNNKIYAEAHGATLISAQLSVAITGEQINTREDVMEVIESIFNLYDRYNTLLDQAVTDNQTELNSYAPDPAVQVQLFEVLSFTLSNLSEIILDAQQRFEIVNEADSNPIVLTHRVYGLNDDDSNLTRFIETNNLSLDELLIIPKDRLIVYFV